MADPLDIDPPSLSASTTADPLDPSPMFAAGDDGDAVGHIAAMTVVMIWTATHTMPTVPLPYSLMISSLTGIIRLLCAFADKQ